MRLQYTLQIMKRNSIIILIAFVFISCKDSINDQNRRNADNCWWVDAKTGKGKWIPIGDQNSVKNGRYTLFYANGNIFEHGKLVDGKYADTTFNYDSKGGLLCYSFENADSTAYYFPKNGQVTLNYHRGGVHLTGVVEKHSLGDKFKGYYRNGNINWVRDLNKGIGWVTNYYENGNIRDSNYTDGMVSLNWKHWFENGHIQTINTIAHHNFNGVSKYYFESGGLKSLQNMANGEANGETKSFREDGTLEGVQHLKNGVREGQQVAYFKNGKIQIDANYKNGQPDGEVKVYNEDGTLFGIKIYKDGHEISRQKF